MRPWDLQYFSVLSESFAAIRKMIKECFGVSDYPNVTRAFRAAQLVGVRRVEPPWYGTRVHVFGGLPGSRSH
jgi:hypothetical protein